MLVLVLGCGPIGLVTMAVCQAYGAANIVVADLNAGRIQFAETFVKCSSVLLQVLTDTYRHTHTHTHTHTQIDILTRRHILSPSP